MSKEGSSQFSIPALRSGDRSEFARLVEATSASIYRLGLKMLGNAQDAEDVLQNTYMKAFEHISEFENRSNLSTWLYRIAANEALMLIRKKHPETRIAEVDEPESDDPDYRPLQLADWTALPEDILLSSEAKDRVDQAIRQLPAGLRIVFILRDMEDLSIQETADSLRLSTAAVKTRLLRARLRMRDNLSAYYDERLRNRSKSK